MVLVFFGGTGDLAYRKLFPAMYSLMIEKRLEEDFKIIGIGSREKELAEYINSIEEGVNNYARRKYVKEEFLKFSNHISYLQGNVMKEDIYKKLSEIVKGKETIFYLAVKPAFFSIIALGLKKVALNLNKNKLMIEKPFGFDLSSAKEVHKTISKCFTEEQVYRIDHYLGKEMTNNLLVLKFGNELFEPLLCDKYIDNIQISASETIGILDRGRYYEESGAMRDMVQNHLMQLLSLALMDKPKSMSAKDIIDKKVEIIEALELFDDVSNSVVLGQYDGYLEEKDVLKESKTETFVFMKVKVNTKRWKNTRIYLKTGKALDDKYVQVVYEFKKELNSLFRTDLGRNRLVVRIQPHEGTMVQFNLKRPGNDDIIDQVAMDFCQSCRGEINSPEAYEKLLNDAMQGEKMSFTRWDEVKAAWEFVNDYISSSRQNCPCDLKIYDRGKSGPIEVLEMLEKDGVTWFGNRKED